MTPHMDKFALLFEESIYPPSAIEGNPIVLHPYLYSFCFYSSTSGVAIYVRKYFQYTGAVLSAETRSRLVLDIGQLRSSRPDHWVIGLVMSRCVRLRRSLLWGSLSSRTDSMKANTANASPSNGRSWILAFTLPSRSVVVPKCWSGIVFSIAKCPF